MIRFSNGRSFEYFVASGALAFDGKGWWWDRPFIWLGLLDPKLFAVTIKSVTLDPTKGNLKLWRWWTCIRLLRDGAVNKVGLTNPGMDWWEEKIGPKVEKSGIPLIGSIFGNEIELVHLATRFNRYPLVAIEVNPDCPNTGHEIPTTDEVIRRVKRLKLATCHPMILKLSATRDCVAIAKGLAGTVEAISFNTVPWSKVFPNRRSPLHKLDTKQSPGAGGVSGKPIQPIVWPVMMEIKRAVPEMKVIGSSVMCFEDLERARSYGADAISFGCIHMRTPWRPTRIVRHEQKHGIRYPDLTVLYQRA